MFLWCESSKFVCLGGVGDIGLAYAASCLLCNVSSGLGNCFMGALVVVRWSEHVIQGILRVCSVGCEGCVVWSRRLCFPGNLCGCHVVLCLFCQLMGGGCCRCDVFGRVFLLDCSGLRLGRLLMCVIGLCGTFVPVLVSGLHGLSVVKGWLLCRVRCTWCWLFPVLGALSGRGVQ